MIATSGLVSRIHACDFSKPEKIRFQYGSSVLPLSSAAPMAGTCDEPIPAMILAKGLPLPTSLPFRSGFRFCFDFSGFGLELTSGRFAPARAAKLGRRLLAGARAVAFDGAAACQHHRRVILLGRTGHQRREMLKRMPVGGAKLGGEIDVAAELQHAVVVALENG